MKLPSALNVRCVEWIKYNEGHQLENHKDSDTIYTISILTHDKSSFFSGGRLAIQDPKNETFFQFAKLEEQGDAVLFLGEVPLLVTPVVGEKREVIVIEFWDHSCNVEYRHSRCILN